MDAILVYLMYFGMPAVLIFSLYLVISFFKRLAEQRAQKMAEEDKYKNAGDEHLLFMLKYQPLRVAWRVFMALAIVLPVGLILVVKGGASRTGFKFLLVVIGGSLISFAAVFAIFDSLFSKEIRIYKDKIIKVWHLLGRREIELRNARLDGKKMVLVSTKTISNQDTKFLANFRGIFYNEHLANQKDIKKLNGILAELTGRKSEDFEQSIIKFKKLIKEANNE
ncbi:MAG: hypothetical protein WC855_06150 [Thermodesulfovibrionales bacterium]